MNAFRLCRLILVATAYMAVSTADPGESVSVTEPDPPSCTAEEDVKTAISETNIRRFPRSEFANYTEYLPCLNELPSSLVPFVPHYRHTTREPPYTTLPCSPAQCFRGVYDGYEHLLTSGLSLEEIADHAQELFYTKEFVPRNTPIQIGTLRQKTHHGGSPTSIRNRDKPYEQIHMDYFEIEGVVTALLYAEFSENLEGGETCFAEAFTTANNSAGQEEVVLQQGMMIEPKRGRLVLFSGGGENLHGPLPIRNKNQQRQIYNMFFKCKDQSQVVE